MNQREKEEYLREYAILKAKGKPFYHHDGAWQDLMAVERLGRLTAQGGTLIERLVGMAIVNMAVQAEVDYLDFVKPDAARLKGCLHELTGLPTMPLVAATTRAAQLVLPRRTAAYLAVLPRHALLPWTGCRGPLRGSMGTGCMA